MKSSYSEPTAASWEFKILPYRGDEKYLTEDAPLNDDTRDMYRLIEPVRDWLAAHKHDLSIDRGDFGEGAEHFYITVFSQEDADSFAALCESLKP